MLSNGGTRDERPNWLLDHSLNQINTKRLDNRALRAGHPLGLCLGKKEPRPRVVSRGGGAPMRLSVSREPQYGHGTGQARQQRRARRGEPPCPCQKMSAVGAPA